MMLRTLRVVSLAVIIIGVTKIWMHLQSGAVLTMEGCQGRVFEVPLGNTSVHCWGCYLAVFGALALVASFAMPNGLITRWQRAR